MARGRGLARGRGRGQRRGRGRAPSRGGHSRGNQPGRSRSPIDAWQEGGTILPDFPFNGSPGIKVDIPSSILKYTQLFCLASEDLQLIAEQTNIYASQYFQEHPKESLPPFSRMKDWDETKGTCAEELKLFFALVIAMGLVPKHEMENFWSTDEVTVTPFFTRIMTRNRFELLMKFLHLADNSKAKKRGEDGYDPLFRVREIHDRFLKRCREVYHPDRDLSLDEATILWKGNVSYRVYNPKKPIKFGLKVYEVCEAKSGYVVNWQFYTGKTDQAQEHGHTYRVVHDLLDDDLRGKGYRVYTDRYYTSPKLYEDLYEIKIGCTGTVMKNRQGMPRTLVDKKLKRGDSLVHHKNHIQCVKWKDKRDIYLLTTINSCEMEDTGKKDRKTGEPIVKPSCVLEYNKHMGGVDRNDQMGKYYSLSRKVMKVWKKKFFYMLNNMILQAYMVYLKTTEDTPKKSQYLFRLELC